MPFMRLNGITVPVADGSATLTTELNTPDERSELGDVVYRRRKLRSAWDATALCLSALQAEGLKTLVQGMGHSIPFDVDLWSTRGRPPTSLAGATIVPGGRFGSGASVTSLTYDFGRDGVSQLFDRWTVMVYRQEAGVFVRYTARCDGAVFVNGVLSPVPVASFLTVTNGLVTLTGAPTVFDDLVVLFGALSDDQIAAVYTWLETERHGFSALPALVMDGDVIEGRELSVVGELSGVAYNQSGGNTDLGLGAHRNNDQRVSFVLRPQQLQPRIRAPRPQIFLSLDTADDVSGVPLDLASPLTPVAFGGPIPVIVTGQVGQARVLTATSYIVVSGGLNPAITDSTAFTLAQWVNIARVPGASVASQTYFGKADGTLPGYWFGASVNHTTGLATPKIVLANAAELIGRIVTSNVAHRLDEWVHIAVTYNGSGSALQLRLYINGELVPSTVNVDTAPPSLISVAVACWGRSAQTATPGALRPLTGSVDELGVWFGQELSPGEIAELYRWGTLRQRVRFEAE